MKSAELKFLLKLLGQEGYRAPISKLNPSEKTKTSERDKICKELAVQALISYTREVSQFKIEPTGVALLKQDTAQLPVSEYQLAVLQACAQKSTSPGKVTKVPAAERQAVIQDLEAKGLLKATKVAIKEVWLTEQGKTYLIEDCNPSGTASISLNLLQNYLRFLRREMVSETSAATPSNSLVETGFTDSESIETTASPTNKQLSDTELLSLIQKLDHELGTENYLPIFHLRQKLQSLSRDELDHALYRLQRSDAIELSSLQEADAYTAEQIDAGIPQNVGGPLFFIAIAE